MTSMYLGTVHYFAVHDIAGDCSVYRPRKYRAYSQTQIVTRQHWNNDARLSPIPRGQNKSTQRATPKTLTASAAATLHRAPATAYRTWRNWVTKRRKRLCELALLRSQLLSYRQRYQYILHQYVIGVVLCTRLRRALQCTPVELARTDTSPRGFCGCIKR